MSQERALAQEIQLGSPDVSALERVGSGDETRYEAGWGVREEGRERKRRERTEGEEGEEEWKGKGGKGRGEKKEW